MPPPAKRRKTAAVEEVTFDTASRADYLTGFHKRKQARIKHSQELALKREKEEKRSQREALREQRKKDLEEHVRLVNEQMRAVNGVEPEASGLDTEQEIKGTEEWAGIQEVHVEAEWVDEDQYATVTVEEVEITRDGFAARGEDEDSSEDEGGGADDTAGRTAEANSDAAVTGMSKTKRPWSKDKPGAGKPKRKKSRNFKYESKVDRKATRSKQKSKNKAQAMARKARAP